MQRWETALARLPQWAADLALGLALAIVDLATVLPYRRQVSNLAIALFLLVAQNVPLVWRRARPVTTASLVTVPRLAYDFAKFPMAPLPFGPAIAIYTVSDRSSPKVRAVVVAVVAAIIVVSQSLPGHNQPYDAIQVVLIMATAWLAGAFSRARRRHLSEVERKVALAQAAAGEEREQMARELHDVVAHHVSVIAVQAEAALALLPGRPTEAERSVEVIGSTSRQAMTELRQLLGALRRHGAQPDTEPIASLSSLGDLIGSARAAGLGVTLDTLGKPSPLSPMVQANAYRIVQEALTNTLKHSPTSTAAVVLTYEPSCLTVSVRDSGGNGRGSSDLDGAGAGPPGQPSHGAVRPKGTKPQGTSSPGLRGAGFGLAGITERVALCGGSLSVGPTPDGFAVVARLPVQ